MRPGLLFGTMKKFLLLLLLGLAAALPAAAQDLALLIEHESVSLGADGVTRTTRFAERLIRRDQQSWIVRVIPDGAHENAEHQAGDKAHKHMDLSSAARWIELQKDGKVRVRLVNNHDRLIVNVPPVDYANIGFDGKWISASNLLDPNHIKKMKASNRTAPAGARWYEGGTKDAKVFVLWDEEMQYPRRIESANNTGTRRNVMAVKREPMPKAMPWSSLKGFTEKEYSDLLD